ncbi:UDP pyrophosphate synthase [Alkalihalobacillus alcalophilus ATCC 27647 = CGMCC 1.3604]|uniref:Isoprenyl transferase n=1 Tax=Alkalihalobacillus alcalophilus ATCC 27647 = CGMCC 1.3604 TaxID=1218173 RepID=A0A094WKF0_ALKAL|nr:isoprenyl transferase [Alkalihalobacillus alcalophilus]KGA98219.1 UDP pyrophosphate synthase [Alkalihalobacillus alcalophilus ATCC 27647 = CGMCC 1.3604]MED1562159.1 isoprenyl transferase [Alkalihalobacillus alcalophilus]THG91384.1 UDP pyrophosphate synthase [Alkalihalobacillus alcalophilus ATCC 27647 = CGMCC 1.3604]
MLDRFSKWRAKEKNSSEAAAQLEHVNIPEHVAIIMDGNGRWAKKKGLPRVAGHREGMKVVNKIVRKANDVGVKVLTLYAFSTENWKRPKTEVDFLLRLPERYLNSELPTLKKENVRVRLMGSLDNLPDYTLRAVRQAVEETKDNTGLILNFALNYGSRFEMLEAIKQISEEVKAGKLESTDINEELMQNYLMTAQLSDPDLLIRTSGEIRLSNFMLWQAAYSELWFTDVLWPDFNEHHFTEAIAVYQKRARRYGGV